MVNDQRVEQQALAHRALCRSFCIDLIHATFCTGRQYQISIAYHAHDRLLQVRLNFSRPQDFVIVYQQAWSMQYGTRQILSKRQHIWTLLHHCLERLPERNQVIICGDFNTPLNHLPHQMHTTDPKYPQAAQRDKQTFTQLVQQFKLVALHWRNRFHTMFKHGTHASRIDFALMRKQQINWPFVAPQLLPDFAFNFGLLGPHHHPLTWTNGYLDQNPSRL